MAHTAEIKLNAKILNNVAPNDNVVVIWMGLGSCIHFEKVSLCSIGSEFQ